MDPPLALRDENGSAIAAAESKVVSASGLLTTSFLFLATGFPLLADSVEKVLFD
jgi:hypothetical protein